MLRNLTLVSFLLAACGDDVPPPDAGGDVSVDASEDTGVDSGPLVTRVAPPSPPDFSTCPEGWRSVERRGVSVCEPWPASGRADCGTYEAHFPGEPGCTRIGSLCPEDGWPTGLPAEDVVYVRADATLGDGSRDAPFATIQEAIAVVPTGGTVAIAVGRYDVRGRISDSMTLRGACAAGVVLYRSGTGGIPILQVWSVVGVEFRDLTMYSDKADVLLSFESDVTLTSVVLDGAAFYHQLGDIALEEVLVQAYSDEFSPAVSVSGVGDSVLSRVVVRDTGGPGVSVGPTGSLDMQDVAVHGTPGVAVFAYGSEGMRLARIVAEDAAIGGVVVAGAGTSEDILVRNISGAELLDIGFFAPSDHVVDRLRVEDVVDLGISLAFGETTIRDLLVIGAESRGGGLGRGVEVAGGATTTIERMAVFDTADLAVLVDGAGTSASFSDLIIDEVETAGAGNFGRCLHAQSAADVDVARAHITRCREAAITASFSGDVELRDVRIERILPLFCETGACEEPQAGVGLVALEMGGRIDAERFVVSEAALAGVQVVPGGEIDIRDGTIENSPVGINVQVEGYDLARVMDRVVFRDNGANLDSDSLPVPEATVMASEL